MHNPELYKLEKQTQRSLWCRLSKTFLYNRKTTDHDEKITQLNLYKFRNIYLLKGTIFVCVRMCMCSHVCMWGTHVNIGCLSQLHPTLFTIMYVCMTYLSSIIISSINLCNYSSIYLSLCMCVVSIFMYMFINV